MAELEPDLSHIHWSSPEWIFHLPTKTLSTPDEALDYFALSPFWDVKSNNHALRTQRRVFDPFYASAQERLDLPSFRGGFEYVVSHSRAPDLFLIQRRDVQPDGSRSSVTGMFFILQGKVYLAPTLFDVLNTRVKNANHLLSETFQQLSAARPPSNPRVPPSWQSLPPVASSSKLAAVSAKPTAAPTPADPSMSTEDEQKVTDSDIQKEDAQRDFMLYNALQASRGRLDHLQHLAQNDPPETHVDPQPNGTKGEEKTLSLGRDGTSSTVGASSAVFQPNNNQNPRLGLTRGMSSRTPGPSAIGGDSVASPMSFT